MTWDNGQMGDEIDTRGIEGRVVTGGIAQSVTREDGGVRVRLTHMPGTALPHESYGGAIKYEFPEPVTVNAGEWIAVDMEWLPQPDREQAGQPVHMRHPATVTNVSTLPSAAKPGTTQGAIGDAATRLPPW